MTAYLRIVSAPSCRSNSSGRIVRYRFSTPEVARDQHTISAWKLDNFRTNPVFQWAHDRKLPPIGKVIEITDNKGYLDGSVEYAERDIYPFADTIFQLVHGGYLNAVSTSWDPLEYKFSTDRSRPGGIDFKLVDLLELSQVPVPALPTALASARAAGIDMRPMAEWTDRALDERSSIVSRPMLLNVRQTLSAAKTFSVPSSSLSTIKDRELRARLRRAKFRIDALERKERERRNVEPGTPEQRRTHAMLVRQKYAAKYLSR